MRPKAVIFSASFAFVLALSLLAVPQDASASSPSKVATGTPDVAGSNQSFCFAYFNSGGGTYETGSTVNIRGVVTCWTPEGPESVKGLHVMVVMTDPNGMDYLALPNADADGYFETDFFLRFDVPGNYSVEATPDAPEKNRVSGTMDIMVVVPPPEPEEEVDPLVVVQIGALIAAFASLAIASTESAGFSMFNIFAFPMYSRLKKEEVLDHFVRGQIYGFIVSNPGEHYNSIRETMKITNGTLSYHLRTLEVQGFIKSRKESVYRRFYPVEMRFPRDKGVRLSDLQIAILELTNRRPAPTQKDISHELEISQQVASYNLRILARKGYIQVLKEGRRRTYYQIESERPTSL
ncbi:MAG: transcriptional regulator [Thermoplasmata archaeon]|nr:transcriptional regulator [Thermoplasmata archaeon]